MTLIEQAEKILEVNYDEKIPATRNVYFPAVQATSIARKILGLYLEGWQRLKLTHFLKGHEDKHGKVWEKDQHSVFYVESSDGPKPNKEVTKRIDLAIRLIEEAESIES